MSQNPGAMRLEPHPFGNTGLRVSPLILAAWSMGGGPALSPEDVEWAYHELGVTTFFLTRQMRALTEGVRRLVEAGHRDRLTLISMANVPVGPFVRGAWEKNARALGVDSIDVFLLGWVQGRWWVSGRTWPELSRLREEGKARAIGFSAHDRPLAASLARELSVDALMIRYNAAHRGAEKEVFEALAPAPPAVVAYTATRWGSLLKPRPGFPAPMTAGECYRFALGHPAVGAVMCAAGTREELAQDVAAVLEGPLEPERRREILRFGDAVHAGSRWAPFRWSGRE